MPLISKKFLINSAYLETKSAIIFELKLLKSSIYFLVKMFIYALFYLDLLTSQYIPLSDVLLDCGKTNNFCQDGYFLDEKGAFEESYEPSLDMIR